MYTAITNLARRLVLAFPLKVSARSYLYRFALAVAVLGLHACASSLAPAPAPAISRADSVSTSHYVYDKDSVSVLVRYQEVRDTIYRDSIVFKWNIKVLRDTIYHSSTDTIQLPPEYIQVERELTWWEDKFIKIGKIAMVLFVGIIIVLIYKIKF